MKNPSPAGMATAAAIGALVFIIVPTFPTLFGVVAALSLIVLTNQRDK